MSTERLSEVEIETVVGILKKLDPGFLPYRLFLEIARLYVSCVVEVVPLYDNDGDIQVLLLKRGEDDDIWAGKLHTPGTIVRASDEEGGLQTAFERVLSGELSGIPIKKEPTFVKTVFHQVARGRELALVFYVVLETNDISHIGTLHSVNRLPAEIIDTQIEFIQDVVKSFAPE